MSQRRNVKIGEELMHRAAEFFARTANRDTLLTVTNADISPDMRRATILFTVYPESKETAALSFANRQRSEFREYLKGNTRLKYLPAIEFALDLGEKNRQRIDDLTNEK